MSLFGGLFGDGGAGKSSLFSGANKFKVFENDKAAATFEVHPEETSKTKKRKQVARDAPAQQAAEPAAKTAGYVLKTAAAPVGGKNKRQKYDAVISQTQQQAKQRDKPSKKAIPHTATAATKTHKGDKKQSKKQKERQQSKNPKDFTHVEAPVAATDSSDSEPEDGAGSESEGDDADTVQAQQLLQQQQQQQHQEKEDQATAAEKLARTVFVGNLPVTIKRKAIARLFAQYGAVDSVRLRSVPLDLESKKKLPRKAAVIKGVVSGDRGGANAYVVFKDAVAATAALAANMTEVDGHHMRVDRAAPPAAAGGGVAGVMYEPARSIFVGNLDFKVTEEDMIKTFSSGKVQAELAGAVEAVRVVRDSKTNIGKGIAYVLFKTKAAARAALQLDGSKLRERAMRVSRVDRKASAGGGAPVKKFGGKQDGKFAGKGGKFAGQGGKFANKGAGARGGAAGALGVRHGGVQKRSAAAAADWQGLRTKGKGAGFRAAKGSKAEAAGNKGSRVNSKHGKSNPASAKGKGAVKSKRPAVAARKAKAKAAAAKAKKGGSGK